MALAGGIEAINQKVNHSVDAQGVVILMRERYGVTSADTMNDVVGHI